MGRLDEAVAAYAAAINFTPGKVHYFWNLANAKRFTASDPHLIAMQKRKERLPSLPVDEQVELHFALGKALTDIGDRQQAFDHILRGNTLKRQQIVYAEAATLERLEQIQRVFSADFMREKKGVGDPSSVPIFILGMPRSGTTLVEQILASHPKVFGAGELAEIGRLAAQIQTPSGNTFPEAATTMSSDQLHQFGADYVRSVRRLTPQADKITNKMPANYLYAGLIHLLLPNARIIHTCRDLRDTALSCFSILWPLGQDHTYDLAELGRYCRGYDALMEHWHNVLPQDVMLDVQYEALVTDLEQQARRIMAHCGLEWDDACLAFYQTDRVVRTASASQVRQPIYTSSVGRWRAYEFQLQPLLEALEGKSPSVVVTPTG